jgi:hypothetical protein
MGEGGKSAQALLLWGDTNGHVLLENHAARTVRIIVSFMRRRPSSAIRHAP